MPLIANDFLSDIPAAALAVAAVIPAAGLAVYSSHTHDSAVDFAVSVEDIVEVPEMTSPLADSSSARTFDATVAVSGVSSVAPLAVAGVASHDAPADPSLDSLAVAARLSAASSLASVSTLISDTIVEAASFSASAAVVLPAPVPAPSGASAVAVPTPLAAALAVDAAAAGVVVAVAVDAVVVVVAVAA